MPGEMTALLRLIVPVLIAGDVQARVVSNPKSSFIEVRLIDGGRVLWGISEDAPWWAYSIIDPDGDLHTGLTGVGADASPEEVARLIATYNYPAPVEFPVGEEE